MPKMLSRPFIYGLLVLVWGVPLVLAAELFARFQHNAIMNGIQELERPQWEEFTDREQEIIAQYGEGPLAITQPRSRFHAMSPADRRAYAREWNETAFVCDAEGIIQKAYHADAPAEVVALTQTYAVGDSILPLFPAEDRADAAEQIARTAGEGDMTSKQHAIALPNGEMHQFKILIEPLAPEEARAEGDVAVGVFVRRHIFREPLRAYYPKAREISNQRFSTNALGWRDGPIALPKPAGQYRIVCIGGSTTVEGPTNALTYPNILEQKLQRTFPETDIEVVNCGVYGLDAGGEQDRLSDYLALDPDLILYYSFGNDLAYNAPGWLMGEGLLDTPWRTLKWRLRASRFVASYFNEWLLPPEPVLRAFYETVPLSSVRAIIEAAQEGGITMVLSSVAYPAPAKLSTREQAFMDYQVARFIWEGSVNYDSYVYLADMYNDMLASLAKEADLPFLPAADVLRGGMPYFYDPFHMTLAGIEAKAEVLHDLLVEKVLEKADIE